MNRSDQSRTRGDSAGPDPVDLFVGQRIRALRRQKGLTQKQLADALGVTFQQVQKYERGGNRVSASTLSRIAAMLGCRVSSLFPPDGPDEEAVEDADRGAEEELARLAPLLSPSRLSLLVHIARQFAALDLKG